MTPLHLSRLTFDDRDPRTARDLASPYALHQTLRWAFPGAGVEGGERRHLLGPGRPGPPARFMPCRSTAANSARRSSPISPS